MSRKPKCKVCKNPFERVYSTLQKTCSVPCARKDAENTRIANSKHVERENRKKTRLAKERLKTRSDRLKSAQTAFNAFIRERDKNENCISCQRPPKKRNAGHYKSVGAFPELRFSEFNCHLQCEHCNTYKSGNQVQYRQYLQDKIGSRNLRWIEGEHQAQNWSIEDIKEIEQYYKEQLKLLKQRG